MAFGISSGDVKVKISSEKDCVQVVTVELPVSKVKEKIEQAFQAIQARAKLPGFRPGKTPIQLIQDRFRDSAYADAEDALLREGVSEALRQKNIQAVQPPVIQSVQF